MIKPIATALIAAATLAGCTTGYRTPPVEVTRYHLNQPLERTSLAIEPIGGSAEAGPEFQLYADAVANELATQGYVRSLGTSPSGYIAAVGFRRTSGGAFREPSPFSIGLGGGSYSGGRHGGVGVGGGVSVPVGKGKLREIYVSELTVQLRRRSDNTVVWEGRALAQAVSGSDAAQPAAQAARMARALFTRFPGESGVTISVK